MFQKAQVPIFSKVQPEYFNKEIKHLMSKKGMVPRYSIIIQLDTFLDSDDTICLCGGLGKSSLTEAEQHPVNLPKKRSL